MHVTHFVLYTAVVPKAAAHVPWKGKVALYLKLHGIGVSLVSEAEEELCYMYARAIEARAEQDQQIVLFRLAVSKFQVRALLLFLLPTMTRKGGVACISLSVWVHFYVFLADICDKVDDQSARNPRFPVPLHSKYDTLSVSL